MSLGFQAEDTEALVVKALQASSMQGNPVRLAPEEVAEIIKRAM